MKFYNLNGKVLKAKIGKKRGREIMETKDEFQYILTPYKNTVYYAIEIYLYFFLYSLLFIFRGVFYSVWFIVILGLAVTLLILKQMNIYNIIIDRQEMTLKKVLGKDFSIAYEDIQKIGFESYGDSRLRSITIYLYSYDRIYEYKVSRYDIDALIEILSIKCINYSIELDTKDLEPIKKSWLIDKVRSFWRNRKEKTK